MDRLSSLLELFSPKTLKVELLSEQYSELEFTGDSTIGLVYRGSAELFTNNSASLIIIRAIFSGLRLTTSLH